jgi:hypothetical protein
MGLFQAKSIFWIDDFLFEKMAKSEQLILILFWTACFSRKKVQL